MDFSYNRNGKEAVGFYIAWVVVIGVLGAITSASLGPAVLGTSAGFGQGFDFGTKVGGIMAVLCTLFFAIKIPVSKRLFSDFKTIVFVLASGVLAVLGGGFLGMLIPAYMTTREKRSA